MVDLLHQGTIRQVFTDSRRSVKRIADLTPSTARPYVRFLGAAQLAPNGCHGRLAALRRSALAHARDLPDATSSSSRCCASR